MPGRLRLRFAVVTIALLLSLPGLAQTADFDVLIDTDRNAASGCSVTPPGGTALDGFEHRIRASVNLATFQVDALEQAECAGSGFGAPSPVAGFSVPYPLALNTGIGGADAVELAVARTALGASNLSLLRLAFVAGNGTGSDVLATTDGGAGGPIIFGLPVQIPALSIWGLGALVVILLGLAWMAHRRMGRVGAVMAVMLVTTAAWAMAFALDGDLSDWGGRAPNATDPGGDATDGSAAIDLVAGFAVLDGGDLFFRMDVSDTENQAPVAVDDAFDTDEDTALNIAAPGVLTNDSDAELDPLTAVLDTGPANAQSFTLNTDGSFDYTPAADFNGTDSFSYFANDGQADSAPATVTITVNAVDDPPVALAGTASTDEDSPVTITLTGSDADGDALSFAISAPPANGSLGAITPIDASSAEVVYTPDADFNGADSFAFTVNDGTTTSPAASIAVTINPVNDPPVANAQLVNAVEDTPITITLTGSDIDGDSLSFAIASTPANGSLGTITPIDATSAEVVYTPTTGFVGSDSFSFTVNDGMVDSPAATVDVAVASGNEIPVADAQSTSTNEDTPVVITLTGSDADLDPLSFAISTGPTNGSLGAITPIDATSAQVTYTPGLDFNGADSFAFTVDDGNDTSAAATVTITVDPVNDAPSFTAGADVTVLEDSGAYDQPWATGMTAGPTNESGQVLTFNITGNDNPDLFSAGPALDPGSGDLTFTPAADANGTANITVELMDNGGTANGGVDTSPTQAFAINVTAVNDAPTFTVISNPPAVDEDAGSVITGGAFDISPGPANEAGQGLTFSLTQTSIDSTLSFTSAPTIDASTGNLSHTPAPNAFGSASFDVVLMDDGGTTNGGQNTSPAQSLTITITPVNDPPVPVDHTLTTHSATRITLGAGDVGLLKDGATDVDDPSAALSVSPLVATSTNGALLTLVDADTGTYQYDPPGGFTGGDSFTYEVCDSATTAAPVECATATVNVTVTGPALWVVDPAAAAGGDGSLNRPFQALSNLPGGRATGGRVFLASGTNSGGHGYVANERLIGQAATGNTFDGFFGVQIPTNGTLDGRPAMGGARPTVQGQVTLANGVLARGFNIVPASGTRGLVGSGALTGIDVSQMAIATANATAVDLNGPTGNFTLDSVNANGGANGIVLVNTNSASGDFSIVGDGGSTRNGSGGTIQNMTGNGISLNNTGPVSIAQIRLGAAGALSNIDQSGLRAEGVRGLSVSHSEFVNASGDDAGGGNDFAAIRVLFPAAGSNINLTGNLFQRSFEDHVRIENGNGTIGGGVALNTVSLTQNMFDDNDASGQGNDAFLYVGNNSSAATITVAGNDFFNSDGDHIQVALNGTASADLTIGGAGIGTGNTFTSNGAGNVLGSGITISSGQGAGGTNFSGNLTYMIQGNNIQDSVAAAINVNLTPSSTAGVRYSGTIDSNVIGSSGDAFSGGFGITVNQNGAGTLNATISNNTIVQYDGDHGLLLQARDGSGRLNAEVADNSISEPADAFVFDGLGINAGATSSDTSTVCANVRNNTLTGATGASSGGADFVVATTSGAVGGPTVILPGYTGTAKNASAVVSFLQSQNVGVPSGAAFFSGNSVGVLGTGASCL